MKGATQLIMQLIKSVINAEGGAELPSSLSLEEGNKLFVLAKSHDMAHLCGYALSRAGVELPEEVKRKLQQEQTLAIYRYEQSNYELQEICACFEKAEIDFLPLKGSVIRSLYPEPWLRTSCDIDVLVHEEDLERAMENLIAMGYEKGDRYLNDVSLFSPSGVHLELHFSLIASGSLDKGEELLQKAWEYTLPFEEKCYHKIFVDAMFYYFHIVHMAKHYTYGGCGIRPFVDLYLLHHTVEFDEEKRKTLLEKSGLGEFAKQARILSEIWFGDGEHTELTLQMEGYLLGGGTYGSVQNQVVVQQARRGGKGKYFFARIWMPYEQLKAQYPNLEKRRWLTPIYQIRRWFRLIFGGRMKNSVRELKRAGATDKQAQAQAERMLMELGLK